MSEELVPDERISLLPDERIMLLSKGRETISSCFYSFPLIAYTLIFALCFLLTQSTVLLPRHLVSESSRTLQILIWVVPDFMLDVLWPLIASVLDYAVFEVLSEYVEVLIVSEDDQSPIHPLAAIRKSDSLAALCKGQMKLLSTMATGASTLMQCGLKTWSSWLLSFFAVAIWCSASYRCQYSTVREIQNEKGKRDTAVEKKDKSRRTIQNKFVEISKKGNRVRLSLRAFLIVMFFVLNLLTPNNDGTLLWIRLGHQLHSLGETLDKMIQSFPKARRIIARMRSRGGVVYFLRTASENVWQLEDSPVFLIIHIKRFVSDTCINLNKVWRAILNVRRPKRRYQAGDNLV